MVEEQEVALTNKAIANDKITIDLNMFKKFKGEKLI
jgi:hypothetical protein